MATIDRYAPLPRMSGDNLELSGFPVYRQETDHTCGPCAVRMALEYMGCKLDEKEVANSCLTHPLGTLHWTLVAGYSRLARKIGYRARMVEDPPEVYELIKDEVKAGRPVIFIYAVEDEFHPPKKVTHYGVVTGMDEKAGSISLANPFGRTETMMIDEWWKRFSLHRKFMPQDQELAVKLGLLKPRTIFVLEQRRSSTRG